jgi:hypothetical protein
VIRNATATYSRQVGEYVKFGKIVFYMFTLKMKITSIDGNAAYASIAGLPYYPYYGYCAGSLQETYQALSGDPIAYMAVHKEDGSRETRINIYDASNTQGASAAK